MKGIAFISKASVFTGDCGSDLHNRENEPARCMHYHDFYEFFVYLGSWGTFAMDGRNYPVKCGDIIPVNMFTPHMMLPGQAEDGECFVAHVNPELLISFSTPTSNLLDIFQKGEAYTPIHHISPQGFRKYQLLMDEYRAVRLEKGQDILVKAIIHQLMAYAYNDCFSGLCCGDAASRRLSVVTKLINYINANLEQKLTLETLAREVNYNEQYICHLFKQATSRTITSYIQQKRIERAAGLLKRSVPAAKAAEQAGFCNYSYFYKLFKKQTGLSPARYRDADA